MGKGDSKMKLKDKVRQLLKESKIKDVSKETRKNN